jgi:UDP-N-acetylmuramoyl-L-alanyl-D-glutamate--2,6-diaminopimelate ligase
VLTNVSQDHLDFHGSFAEYCAVKRRLFEMTAHPKHKAPGTCVLNNDDAQGRIIAAQCASRVLSYGVEQPGAMLQATGVSLAATHATFSVKALRPAPFRVALPGLFNVSNALAALAAACALDIDVEAMADGLETVAPVPGRLIALPAGDIRVYVDYAHTPDGLRRVLEALRPLTQGRLICVFGCGGDRDRSKRPLMGGIAQQLADAVIVTSDNPRSEEPQRIIDDILSGMQRSPRAGPGVEPDRAKAIEAAVSAAQAGDVVLIAGKGHEEYQQLGAERLPFSDVSAALSAIAKRVA